MKPESEEDRVTAGAVEVTEKTFAWLGRSLGATEKGVCAVEIPGERFVGPRQRLKLCLHLSL